MPLRDRGVSTATRIGAAYGTLQHSALDMLQQDVVRADVVEVTEIGMVQRRYGARFPRKPFRVLFFGNLDRDIAPQPRVPRLPHFPIPPAPIGATIS